MAVMVWQMAVLTLARNSIGMQALNTTRQWCVHLLRSRDTSDGNSHEKRSAVEPVSVYDIKHETEERKPDERAEHAHGCHDTARSTEVSHRNQIRDQRRVARIAAIAHVDP